MMAKAFTPSVPREAEPAPSVAAVLRGVGIFAGLSRRQIGRLAKVATRQEFPAEMRILRRGALGVALYVIVRGRVAVTYPSDETGEERTLGELGPGEVFGEMALIDEGPRSANVTARERTECVVLTRWDFGGEMGRDPAIARALLPVLCARIRGLQERLLAFEARATTD